MTSAARAVLDTAPLFAGVNAAALDVLAEAAREQNVPAGGDLFRQAGDPTALHLIVSGRVKVWRSNEQGAAVTLQVFGPGAPVGCVAVLRQVPYPATATAVEPCVYVAIPRAALARVLRHSAALANNACQLIGERNTLFVERLCEAATASVAQRVANTVLRMAAAAAPGERLVATRQDVAEFAGTNLHEVSRLFARWSRQGLIATGRARVAVLDADGLRARASAG